MNEMSWTKSFPLLVRTNLAQACRKHQALPGGEIRFRTTAEAVSAFHCQCNAPGEGTPQTSSHFVSTCHSSSYLAFTTDQLDRNYYYSHFKDEETENQRSSYLPKVTEPGRNKVGVKSKFLTLTLPADWPASLHHCPQARGIFLGITKPILLCLLKPSSSSPPPVGTNPSS